MAALSAASTVDKWDLLPKAVADEFKEDVLKEEQYVTLAKAINRPKFMLKLLYKMLKKGNVMGSDKQECANYLVQYLNTQSDGDNESKLKVDPVTFFMNVFGGMNVFPMEIIASMEDVYNSNKSDKACLKTLVKKNNMKLNTLALQTSPSGERARKVIYDQELQEFIKDAYPGDKWNDYFDSKKEGSGGVGSSGKKAEAPVTERDLAFRPLAEWREEEWDLARQPFIMITPDLENASEVAMISAGLKEEAYVDYKQKALLIEQMGVDTSEDVTTKMDAIS